MTTPLRELEIDDALVRDLLRAQHPDLAALPREFAAEGWDNVMVRLGDDLVLRMPRRAIAAPLVVNEQRWLPVLAPLLPVAVPVPLALGVPSEAFPWAWHVSRWLPGERASVRRGGGLRALDLARTLAALHVPAPADAPHNTVRAVPLAPRTDVVLRRLARGGLEHLLPVWEAGVSAPLWPGAPVWVHGDPHPGNALLEAGTDRLSALLDFGDLSSGDPACDLAAGWLHLDAAGLDVFRRSYDDLAVTDDPGRWERAAAWALSMASSVAVDAPDDRSNAGWSRAVLADLTELRDQLA